MFDASPERDDDAESSADSDDEHRFRPSPLDMSVRIGHGGSEGEQVRALEAINEQAREIEAEHRDD